MNQSRAIFRIGSYLILLSMLLCLFVGCKSDNQSDESKNDAYTTMPSDSEAEDATEADTQPQDTEPEQETRPTIETEPVETLPDTYQVAIVDVPALIVRREPGEDQDAIRKLNEGDEVRVYIQQTVNGALWGYVGDGWINLGDIVWKDQAEVNDAALQNQIVGSWYQLYEDGAEIWTFRSSGSFSYDVYFFDSSTPGAFGELNDEWCGGSYEVKNGKLVISFNDRMIPSGFTVLCGNSYYHGDTARLTVSVNTDEMTLQDTQTVTFLRGDIYQIMEERNAVSEDDQAILDQLIGSWYEEMSAYQYRVFTFRNDGCFTHDMYGFNSQDPTDFYEDTDLFCRGSYTVKNGILTLSFDGYMENGATISLAGISCKKNDTHSFSIQLDLTTLKISEFSTTTLTRGTAEDIVALLKQNAEPPVEDPTEGPSVTDTRILGNWYYISDIDYENQSLRIGNSYTFYADGTFNATLSDSAYYYYDSNTSQLIYDINNPAMGDYCYSGTYTFDGTTLIMIETENGYGEPVSQTPVETPVTISGNKMIMYDNGNAFDHYSVNWLDIGAYFFGDGA